MSKATSSKRGKIGDNSLAVDVLKTTIARVEKLEEEKQGLSDDIREVYSEAKGNGLDPKIIKQIVKMRKLDESERAEQIAIMRVYCEALGITDPFS